MRSQLDCDVDENVMLSRVAQMSCTRRKNTWHHVVDLSCFPMFLMFRHAARKHRL